MSNNEYLKIPAEAAYVINKLNNHNYKAYLVGGCVRDSILGKQPKDWDITTDANSSEIKALFDKTIDTGIKHGTVTVVLNNNNIEITTFRSFSPKISQSIIEDLSHRDLTINAIAFHPEEGLIDPHMGVQDIRNSVIRTVGSPHDRFDEDPLRMLRTIRFCAVLGFGIDRSTIDTIKEKRSMIKNISHERIRDELTKILTSGQPFKFTLLRETGILKYVLPEFDICFDTAQNHPYHVFNVAMHSLKAVSEIESEVSLRWTMLLHDTGKAVTKSTDKEGIDHFYGHPEKSTAIAREVLERLKFDNKTVNRVCHLIKYHDRRIQPDYKSVRKAASVIGKDSFLDLLKVQEADKRSQNPEFLDDRLQVLKEVREIYMDIIKKQQCINIKDMKIDGNDLVNLGYGQGKEIGSVLKKLLDTVIDKPELNTREDLMKIAKSYKE